MDEGRPMTRRVAHVGHRRVIYGRPTIPELFQDQLARRLQELDALAAARDYQERRAMVNNEIALQEVDIGVPLDQIHTRDPARSSEHGKPRFTWRAAWPVIGIWVLVVILSACLYICARALVTPWFQPVPPSAVSR